MKHAAFVEAHFRVTARSGAEYSVLCPVHGDRNASMRINVEKGVFICHACGVRGGMVKLGRLVGVNYRVGEPDQMSVFLGKLDKLRKDSAPVEERFMPESMLKRFQFPSEYWTKERGLTPETIEAFDLGFDPLDMCATIPVRDMHGRLLGVTRRYVEKDAPLRYKDPKGFRKNDHLFGAWLVAQHESATVVLVEGPIDCMKVWQSGHPALAQYMSYLSPNQIRILRRLGVVKVVLFYDNDKAGRKAYYQALGWTYDPTKKRPADRWKYNPETDLRRFFVVAHAKYPSRKIKDPGMMQDQDICRAVCDARYVL